MRCHEQGLWDCGTVGLWCGGLESCTLKRVEIHDQRVRCQGSWRCHFDVQCKIRLKRDRFEYKDSDQCRKGVYESLTADTDVHKSDDNHQPGMPNPNSDWKVWIFDFWILDLWFLDFGRRLSIRSLLAAGFGFRNLGFAIFAKLSAPK